MQDESIQASEDFIRMIQVLAEDEELTRWFLSLRSLADNMRYSIIGAMVEQMKSNNEDAGLVAAVQSLMEPSVYVAAFNTISMLRK